MDVCQDVAISFVNFVEVYLHDVYNLKEYSVKRIFMMYCVIR